MTAPDDDPRIAGWEWRRDHEGDDRAEHRYEQYMYGEQS